MLYSDSSVGPLIKSVKLVAYDTIRFTAVVITRADQTPADITVEDVGFSDHSMIQWRTSLPVPSPSYTSLSNAGHGRISSSTRSVLICSHQLSATRQFTIRLEVDCAESLDKVVQLYNEMLTALLDVHALVVSRTTRLRPRKDPWFDNDCREAKKRASKLECRYKRHGSDYSRGKWTNALRDYHKLLNDKRHPFENLKLVMHRMPDKLGGQFTEYCVVTKLISLADLFHC